VGRWEKGGEGGEKGGWVNDVLSTVDQTDGYSRPQSG